mgnify:CR=1 FL=1
MTIKINKKSVVMIAKDGGKYRLNLTNMKIYDKITLEIYTMNISLPLYSWFK